MGSEGPRGQFFRGHGLEVLGDPHDAEMAPDENLGIDYGPEPPDGDDGYGGPKCRDCCRKSVRWYGGIRRWVNRFVSWMEHGGIQSRHIGANEVRHAHVQDQSVAFEQLKAIKVAQLVIKLAVPGNPNPANQVPRVRHHIEQVLYRDVPLEDAGGTRYIGFQTDLVVEIQSRGVTTEAGRVTIRRTPFDAIPDGSFVSPGGHAVGATGHAPNPVHGLSTAFRPLIQIEDGVDSAGIPQKRYTVYHHRSTDEIEGIDGKRVMDTREGGVAPVVFDSSGTLVSGGSYA